MLQVIVQDFYLKPLHQPWVTSFCHFIDVELRPDVAAVVKLCQGVWHKSNPELDRGDIFK